MATPQNIKKGPTLLISTDLCPRGCRTGNSTGSSIHLLSDHNDTDKVRTCNLCACVIQSTAGHPLSSY